MIVMTKLIPKMPHQNLFLFWPNMTGSCQDSAPIHSKSIKKNQEICLQIRNAVDYNQYMVLAISNNWPTVLPLNTLPVRIVSFANDLLLLFSDANSLHACLIWLDLVECQNGNLTLLASQPWSGDEFRVAHPG